MNEEGPKLLTLLAALLSRDILVSMPKSRGRPALLYLLKPDGKLWSSEHPASLGWQPVPMPEDNEQSRAPFPLRRQNC